MRSRLVGMILVVMGLCAGAAFALPIFPGAEYATLTEAGAAADRYEVEKAVALYTKAIESGRLSPPQLAEAYLGRGQARDRYELAYGIRDSELVLALRDYRKSRELMMSFGAVVSEAYTLSVLGAYKEAAYSYRQAAPLEGPSPHWSLIGQARVERIQGRYDAALKHLDEALRVVGTGTMPIYYHRARVLYLQEKFAQAAESITNGLQFQPDYAYAYMYRACAGARTGELAKAVADIDKAVELSNKPPLDEHWEKTPAAKSARQDMARDTAAIKAMAAGKGSEAERAALCTFTWNAGENLRERSPLLVTDDLQIAQVARLSAGRAAPAATSCRGTCDKP